MDEARLNEDFLDLLVALRDAGADFVVVGAHALAVHGVVRAAGHLGAPRACNSNSSHVRRVAPDHTRPCAGARLPRTGLLLSAANGLFGMISSSAA